MKVQRAIFAAGCFWGVQYYFDQVPGVRKTLVGYTGGRTKHPTYDQVCTHTTGHAEALLIEFDADKVKYETLVKHFFRMHDPTQLDRQGPDVGDNYRSEIFTTSDEQYKTALKVKAAVQKKSSEQIVTKIEQASDFYPAEEYHQKFTERTGIGACHVPYERIKE